MPAEVAFIDEENKLLQSRFFPDKIGGLPAWLDLKNIPSTSEILCTLCGLPCHFLCQIYSSVPKNYAFHRSIFIFACLSDKCFKPNSNNNFIVLRNQLPRHNSFYPHVAEGIEHRTDITCSNFGTTLCSLCGIRGELRCDQCEESFCTVHHHKLHTKHSDSVSLSKPKNVTLLPEFALCCEEEDLSDTSDESDGEVEEQLGDTEAVVKICEQFTQFKSTKDDAALEEIFKACSETRHDNTFLKFKNRISHYPEAVLRHSRNDPLWISDHNQPTYDTIPPCDYCGGSREFEFQILPQLLNFLKLDEIENLKSGILDWGTLAVYTCQNSCELGPPYKKEFLWKQDLI